MIRIKFTKDYKQYKKGDVESFSPNEAFGLIDSGKAVISKDMVEGDISTKITETTDDNSDKPAKPKTVIKEK